LTQVSTNKIKGFVLKRNPFREAVQIWPFLLKWANEDAVRQKYEEGRKIKSSIFLPNPSFRHRSGPNAKSNQSVKPTLKVRRSLASPKYLQTI
jgi:hypothetical protein